MVNSKETDKCCAVDIERCDTFDFMANVIGLPILHPGGLKSTKEMANLCSINKNIKVLDYEAAASHHRRILNAKLLCNLATACGLLLRSGHLTADKRASFTPNLVHFKI